MRTERDTSTKGRLTLALRVVGIVTAVLCALALGHSFLFSTFKPYLMPQTGAQQLTSWTMKVDGQGVTTVALPHDVTGLPGGTHVILTTQVRLTGNEYLYLSNRYDRYRVCLDGQQLAEYGAEGSFPSYMLDPPPSTSVINLPTDMPDGQTCTRTLTIEYWSPERYHALLLKVPELGTFDDLRVAMFSSMGFSLFFSLAVLSFGVIMVLTGIFVRLEEAARHALFWLGMLCLLVGLWCVGECDLSCVIFPRPLFLHLCTYIGLYCLLVPISELTPLVLGAGNRLTDASRVITRVWALCAMAGQLTGVWQFSQSLIPFYAVAIGTFSFTVLYTFFSLRRKQGHATWVQLGYLVASSVISACMLLELLDYNFWHTVPEMAFAEIGWTFYILTLDLLAVTMLRDSIALRQQNQVLQVRYDMSRHVLDSNRAQYQTMITSERELRRQRHDFKHQLATIRAYAEACDQERLLAFVESIQEAVPQGTARVCDNPGVNAVALYYLARAQRAGVSCDVLLDVPDGLDDDTTSDLCVVVGNLLENAVMANDGDQAVGAPDGEGEAGAGDGTGRPARWVRMRGVRAGTTLFISQENSCWHVERDAAGNFVSTKGHTGVGLESLRTVARRHGGTAQFKEEGGTFTSRVSLSLE